MLPQYIEIRKRDSLFRTVESPANKWTYFKLRAGEYLKYFRDYKVVQKSEMEVLRGPKYLRVWWNYPEEASMVDGRGNETWLPNTLLIEEVDESGISLVR